MAADTLDSAQSLLEAAKLYSFPLQRLVRNMEHAEESKPLHLVRNTVEDPHGHKAHPSAATAKATLPSPAEIRF